MTSMDNYKFKNVNEVWERSSHYLKDYGSGAPTRSHSRTPLVIVLPGFHPDAPYA